MTTLRSYIDPDQQSATTGPTIFMTERNQVEVRCGVCCRISYVDEDTYCLLSAAIEAGRENPFRCEICEEE